MKNRLLFITMAAAMVIGLSGCTKTKTVSYTDENGNTTTTTTTTDKEGTTTVTETTDADESTNVAESEHTDSDDEPIYQEPEYSVIESEKGYKVTYNPDFFVYENYGEYEGRDSVYIRCTIDKENEYENYLDVGTVEGYNAKELIEGIAFQNETEATPMHIVFANGEYDAYYCEKYVTDTFLMSFYAIDGKDAPYLIEVGSHIYSDDDEYAYYVAGVMEEAFLSLEFEQ